MSTSNVSFRLLISLCALALLGVACNFSGTDYAADIQPIDVPDRATFQAPARMLIRRCGTLECHGSNYRNFRLYGKGGRRLNPAHHPDTPETTAEEYDADFDSVISVEPELTSSVVQGGGAYPGVLTITRKGRGEEAHKGGAPNPKGGDADLCWTSWLKDALDTDACERAVSE